LSAPSEPLDDGEPQIFEGHGVWVPKGMTAHEIMVGAQVLQDRFEISPYTARAMVRAVLSAIWKPQIVEEKDRDLAPKCDD
jgi:hypothetical protein